MGWLSVLAAKNGRVTFKTPDDGARPEFPVAVADLIKRCLGLDPAKRPTVAEFVAAVEKLPFASFDAVEEEADDDFDFGADFS